MGLLQASVPFNTVQVILRMVTPLARRHRSQSNKQYIFRLFNI
jgi:hypothetical protein